MYEILSSLLKYIFITIIYLFIFSIIRLIYLDVRSLNIHKRLADKSVPYLKLINRRESIDFRISETYPLDRDVKIGRKLRNEISIQDPFLSSTHAQIRVVEDLRFLKDIDSTNGTFLNGKQLDKTEVQLNDGDRIRLGQAEFLFVNGLQ